MEDNPSVKIKWRMHGANVFQWDADTQQWAQITTLAELPDKDNLWLYKNLLNAFDEPRFYEWKEGAKHYRMERWSDRALAVVRRESGRYSGISSK